MRRALVLAVMLILAGCAAPVPDTTTTPVPDTGTPSDPSTDTLGWEGGYWYNESITTDISNGLNATERNATVARAMARVEHIRRVEFEKPVPVEVISRETYRKNFTGGSSSPALRTFDNAKFEALFLVGETQDSLDQQEENRGSSVLGFYSPSKDQIVIISESETPTIDEITLGHELVHAIQFRNFDPTYQSPTRDAVSAHKGVIEGDARYVDQLYRSRCGTEWSCVKPEANGGGSGSSGNAGFHMGVYLMKYFPYSDGPGFVKHFRENGGWERVNQLYDDPPKSAEQVVHPEKYQSDAPTNVKLEDRSSATWKRVTVKGRAPYGEVGMAGITAMFAYPAYEQSRNDVAPASFVVSPREFLNYKGDSVDQNDPINYGTKYVDGWDGDKMYIYQNDAGETAYVWRLVWDSKGDATEFANGYRDLLRYWGAEKVGDGRWKIPEGESEFADSFYVQVDGDTVTIVNAPSNSGLSEVRSGTPA